MGVSPKIMILYATTFPSVLCPDEITGKDLIEFNKKLTALRKALSCSVCQQLMTNRTALVASTCREHFVCSECRGGNRKDGDKCNKCEEWSVFVEDESLNLVLKSYQSFCGVLLTTDGFTRLLKVKHEVDPKFDGKGLLKLLVEGMQGCKVQRKGNRASSNAAGVLQATIVPRREQTGTNRDGMRAQRETAEVIDLDAVEEIACTDGEAMDDDAEDADDEISVVDFTARPAKAKLRMRRSRRTLEPGAALPSSPVSDSSSSSTGSALRSNVPSQTGRSKSIDEDDDEVLILSDSREGTPSSSLASSISGSPSIHGSNMQQQRPASPVYLVYVPRPSAGLNPSAGSVPQIFRMSGPGVSMLLQQGAGGPLLQAPPNTGYFFQGQGLIPIPVPIAGNHSNAGFPVAQIPAQRPGISQPQLFMTLQQPQGPMDMAPLPRENLRQ